MDNEFNRNCSGQCPRCKKTLTGAVEVIETENEGVPIIHIKETSDRNWIACDGCNLIVCKSCCEKAESGFCNDCLNQLASMAVLCPVISQQNRFG